MFNGVKNQMLAKIKVEKFLSSQYIKFIIEVENLLRSDLNKEQILEQVMVVKDQIIKKYGLTEKDIK